MRAFNGYSTPVESWIAGARQYVATSRFVSLAAIGDAALQAKLDALRDTLVTEALDIEAVYGAATTSRHKRVAKIIAQARAEMLTMAGEVSTGLGGFPELNAIANVAKFKLAMQWCWKWGKWILIAWGVKECGLPVLKASIEIAAQVRQLVESDIDKAARLHGLAQETAAKKVSLIAQCQADNAGNPQAVKACIDSVNQSFEIVAPSGECGILDTPTGSSLGAIMGLFSGFIAGESALGIVE